VAKRNKLVAVCGWRWEPEWLVHDMIDNLAPIVDDIAIVDDRARTGPWGHEGEYRKRQRALAKAKGADWVLLTSPDERFELGAAGRIRDAVEHGPRMQAYSLRVCEMWSMTQYRVDGQFADRQRTRLFPLAAMYGRVKHRRIHSPIIRRSVKKARRRLDVRIYHLKNSMPENRQLRVPMMKQMDTEIGKAREASWDQFLDEDAVLEGIPPERAFYPPYTRPYIWTPTETS